MADLTIYFRGICTHFLKSGVPDLPAPHRVVLPTSIDPPPIAVGRLMPHLPFLYFREMSKPLDEGAFFSGYPLMNGIRLSAGEPGGGVTYKDWRLLPTLLSFRSDYVPDPYVVLKGNADCYFDVSTGAFEVLVFELGEVYTRLTIPNASQITASLGDGTEPIQIPVPDKHYAVVRHLSLPTRGHSIYDFRLHYLTARGSIPRFFDKPLPGEPGYIPSSPTVLRDDWYEAMTPACSNSGYP